MQKNMLLRVLLEVLAPALSDQSNETSLVEVIPQIDFQTPAKFHIGMLSISLIIGFGFGGFVIYRNLIEKKIYLDYVRNLIIALVCRTFFSIIFDGAILLGTPSNLGGGNALIAFEQICLNLVLAFWLTFTIYIHARVQRNFNSEPTLKLYQFGVPGVALFYAFVWIFTLQDTLPNVVWWTILNPLTQWIVNSINLLFLLIQLGLIADISRMMMKISLDNDSISILRNLTIMMGVLILIFWFQFGFTIGRVPFKNSTSYVYFYYFIDGLECAFVCPVLYFFNKWVVILLSKLPSFLTGFEEIPTKAPSIKSQEVLITEKDDQGILATDSVFMTTESGKWRNSVEETKDIVYSNILEPQRLKKTFDLYKRFNVIPNKQVTVIEGEEFYDCQFQSSENLNDFRERKLSKKQFRSFISRDSKSEALIESNNLKNKKCEQVQKKNAFYSSKYLILDSKDNEFPKYLETLPSESSLSEKNSSKKQNLGHDISTPLENLMSDELVRKWLFDHSENMEKNKNNQTAFYQDSRKGSQEPLNDENFGQEIQEQKLETAGKTESGSPQKKGQASVPGTIVSTISSVLASVFFGPSKTETKKSDFADLNATAENDSEKSIALVKEKPKTGESKKEELEKSEVNTDHDITKTNISDIKAAPDVLPLRNENVVTEKFSSAAQEKNFKVLENHRISNEPLNVSKVGTELTVRELSKTKHPTEPDKIETQKPEKDSELTSADEKNSDKTEEPIPPKHSSQSLSYSDLLEFRSQREKQTENDPPSLSKNLLSLSNSVTSTINLLNRNSSSLELHSAYDSKENNKNKNLQINESCCITNKQKNSNPINISETSSESEFSIENNSDTSKGSFSVEQYYEQLMKTRIKFQNSENSK